MKEPVQCSTCTLQKAICLIVYEVVAFFIGVQGIKDYNGLLQGLIYVSVERCTGSLRSS